MKRCADLALAALCAALGACDCWEPAQPPTVQHLHYTTNVYVTQVMEAAGPPETALAPAPAAPRDACEVYVEKARACVRSITGDEAARARAEQVLERLRRAVASADEAQRAEALRACARGLLGYAFAPCE